MRTPERIQAEIMDALATVIDPELGIDVVNLGLINGIELGEDGLCQLSMTLTMMGCPLQGILRREVTQTLITVPEIKHVNVELVWEPAWTIERMSRQARLSLGICR
jgi:metal-sulfur cluster biosynthetic enzyme